MASKEDGSHGACTRTLGFTLEGKGTLALMTKKRVNFHYLNTFQDGTWFPSLPKLEKLNQFWELVSNWAQIGKKIPRPEICLG